MHSSMHGQEEVTGNRMKMSLKEIRLALVISGGVVVLGVGILVYFMAFGSGAQQGKCVSNLRTIAAAKEYAAVQLGRKDGEDISIDEIKQYLPPAWNGMPKCPLGGQYSIGAVGSVPRCSIKGHSISLGDD